MVSTTVATLLSLLVSGLGLAFLNHTDAKRRRTYGLSVWEKPHQRRWAWAVVLLPSLFLMMTAHWPAFIMWLTAVSLLGWGLAVRKPVKSKV